MLRLEAVSAGYGDSTVLHEVSLTIGAGEVVALLGPNGAGKTTLLRTASGVLKPRSGRISLAGEDFTGRPTHEFARRGVCHLPEGRGIFPSLTVRDNLVVQARRSNLRDAIEQASRLFPVLSDRLRQPAGNLSGGQQQMLALARAYIARPELVLVDEASLGLAPIVVNQIYDALAQLSAQGTSLVVVEQYVQKALALAQTVCVLGKGKILHRGDASQITTDEIYATYLGIGS
jgi:branched-chain amino acid transport system ATP-binding protein